LKHTVSPSHACFLLFNNMLCSWNIQFHYLMPVFSYSTIWTHKPW